VYEWRVVADLGLLGTVTGLLAVGVGVGGRWGNVPRFLLILGNLGLCGYTSWVGHSYDVVGKDLGLSLACVFAEGRKLDAAQVARWVALMAAAVGTHFSVIMAMFVFDEPREEQRRKKMVWEIGGAVRNWVVLPAYSIYSVYFAAAGLQRTQAFGTRDWDFAQLLPVLLLALPLLAGWESFWEGETKRKSKTEKKRNWRVEKGMIGSPIPKSSQDSSSEQEKGSSVDSTSPIYTPYSLSPDLSEEEKRTESDGSPELPQIYHLDAFKDTRESYKGRPGTIVEEGHLRAPGPAHTPRQRSSTSRRSLHFSYPNRAPPRSSQARLSQARLSQFQVDAQPILCGHCETLPRESLYLGTEQSRSRRSSHRRSQAVRASYVPL
jgi:hypothetical protein